MERLQEVIEKIEELLEGLKKEHEKEVSVPEMKCKLDSFTPCDGFCCFYGWRGCPKFNPWKPQVIYTYGTDEESVPRAPYSTSRGTITTNPNITITYTTGDTK